MKELLNELLTDQAVLAMFPIVGLSILVVIAALYLLWKERRESRGHSQNPRN